MRKCNKIHLPALLPVLLFLSLIFLLLHGLYRYDNKYTAGPPYGKRGHFSFSEKDLNHPMFLIDGWEFYLDEIFLPEDFIGKKISEPEFIFIGQYSNYSFTQYKHSPFGKATYRLRLHYDGPPKAMCLEIPEIFTTYTLWIDGTAAASSHGNYSNMASFVLNKETELILNVENTAHYYSGLYYPPAFGTPEVISRMLIIRSVFYAVLLLCPLTLALFSVTLWMLRERDPLMLRFAILCLASSITALHPFIWQAGLSGRVWYALEDIARLIMLAQAAGIGALTAGITGRRWQQIERIALPGIWVTCAIFILFIIPSCGAFINLYGSFIDLYSLTAWVWLCNCTAAGIRKKIRGSRFILLGSCTLGAGFLNNLLNNNRFEPIYTGWQTEYTGFIMVLIFGWMMVCRNHDVIEENRMLTYKMEDLVNQRTRELHSILEERKNFFSDMAHNLKAPIAAVHGFINLIREGNLYLDDELNEYIHLIESENKEMQQRVLALNVINSFDQISTPWIQLEISELLEKVYQNNYPDAGVMEIHLRVNPPQQSLKIYGQQDKLLMMFENLIYNAISFTPKGGSITISAVPEQEFVVIRVSDTGCGITGEHLPHIFERYYTVRHNGTSGSGLGLYIVKLTVDELGGTIEAKSALYKGTTFTIRLPSV